MNQIVNLIMGRRMLFTVFICLLTVIYSSFFVYGFAVGFEGTQINLYPGQVRDLSFRIQNFEEGAGEIVAEASILEGNGYVSFIGGNKVNVESGETGNIPVRFTMPEGSRVGKEVNIKVHFIGYSANPVSGEEESGTSITFSNSQTWNINLVSIEEPVEPGVVAEEKTGAGGNLIWWIVGIIVLIIVIWIIIRAMKKSSGQQSVSVKK